MALLICAFLAGCERIWTYDFFLHLAAGDWMLQHRQILHEDLWLADGPHPWINVYWLFQLVLSGIKTLGGYSAISLAKGIALASIVLVWLRILSRKRLGLVEAAALLLGIAVLQTRLRERPETFTFMFVVLVIWILEDVRRGGLRSRLLLLIPIQMTWANMHGLFPIGPLLLALAIAGAHLDARMGRHDPAIGEGLRGRFALIVGLVATCSCLINPWGLATAAYAIRLGGAVASGAGVYRGFVSEMSPLWTERPDGAGILAGTLFVVTIVGLIRNRRSVSNVHVFWIAAVTLLAVIAHRNIGILAAVAPPLAALHNHRNRVQGSVPHVVRVVTIAGPVLLGLAYITGGVGRLTDRTARPGLGLQREIYPLAVAARISSDPNRGVILPLNFGDAGTFIPAITAQPPPPIHPLMIDGRLEPRMAAERWSEARDLVARGEASKILAGATRDVRFVVADFYDLDLIANLSADPAWTLYALDLNHACFVPTGTIASTDPFAAYDLPLVPGEKAILAPHETYVPGCVRLHPPQTHWRLGLVMSILGRQDLGARYLEAAELLGSGKARERRGVLAMALADLASKKLLFDLPIDTFTARALFLLTEPDVCDPREWNGPIFEDLRVELLDKVRDDVADPDLALAMGDVATARRAHASSGMQGAERELRLALCAWVEGDLSAAEAMLAQLAKSDPTAEAYLLTLRRYLGLS